MENPAKVADIPKLDGQLHDDTIRFERKRLIMDPRGEPVILLTISHTLTEEPVLFDKTTLLTLLLLCLVPLVLLHFVSRYLGCSHCQKRTPYRADGDHPALSYH